MANRKRASSSQPEGSRKSSRLSYPPVRLGFDDEEDDWDTAPVDLPAIAAAHPEENFPYGGFRNTFEFHREEYNKLMDFIPQDQTFWQEWYHSRMQKSRDKVQKLFSKYNAELQKLVSLTEEGVNSALDSIHRGQHYIRTTGKYWYANGTANLLSLEMEYLDLLLEKNPIMDPAHFQQYLVRCLSLYLDGRYEGDSYHNFDDLEKKFLRLHKVLLHSSDPPNHKLCLHLSVAWWLELVNTKAEGVHYAAEKLRDKAQRSLAGRDRSSAKKEHWDTAAVYRQVLSAYKAVECPEEDIFMSSWGRPEQSCYHSDNTYILRRLWSDAEMETKSNVHLAVGHILPAELADLIVEFTMDAEDLTADNRLGYWDPKRGLDVETPVTMRCGVMRAQQK